MDDTARQAGNASGFCRHEDTPAGMQRKGDELENRGMRAVGSFYTRGERSAAGGRAREEYAEAARAGWPGRTGDRVHASGQVVECRWRFACAERGPQRLVNECRKGPRGEVIGHYE